VTGDRKREYSIDDPQRKTAHLPGSFVPTLYNRDGAAKGAIRCGVHTISAGIPKRSVMVITQWR